MNKKIKLSLLSVLFASSTLAITLPIVSCSGSSITPTTPTTLTVIKGSKAQLDAIGTAIAALGRNGTNNNTTALTQAESSNALREASNNGYTGAVKNAINAYFTFRDGINNLNDVDVIEGIELSGGEYPNDSNVKIFTQIRINLKKPYVALEAHLTIDVQIGATYTDITIVPDRTKLNALGTEIAQTVKPSAADNNGSITLDEFNQVKTITYNMIRNAVNSVFSFTVGSENVLANDAIDSIRWLSGSGTEYPTAAGDDVNVVMEIMLKNPYQSNGNRVLSIKIGVRPAS